MTSKDEGSDLSAPEGSAQWHLDEARLCLHAATSVVDGCSRDAYEVGERLEEEDGKVVDTRRRVWTAGTAKNAWTPAEAAQAEADLWFRAADQHIRLAELLLGANRGMGS